MLSVDTDSPSVPEIRWITQTDLQHNYASIILPEIPTTTEVHPGMIQALIYMLYNECDFSMMIEINPFAFICGL